jgi:hypothetical protein
VFEPTGTLEDIVPEARGALEELLRIATDLGMQPHVRGAGRTCAMQNALASQGSKVTGASMCRSMHVLGRALDIDLQPSTCATYTRLGEIWERMGGAWGGRWVSQFGGCGDAGHFHWMPRGEGLPSYGSPPEVVCPSSVRSVAECEQLRAAYLAAEFSKKAAAGGDWRKAAGGALLVVGAALILGSLRA